MKTLFVKSGTRERGWALLVVMSLAATGLLLVASVIAWANENATVTARNSELFTTTYAAEAATEKVLSSIVQDDQNYGEGWVFTKYAGASYNSLIPNATDSPYWTNYQFSGGSTNNQVIVNCVCTNVTNYAGPPYSGLQYVGADYEIIANAENTGSMYAIKSTVGQEVVLGQIPIFQFAIFYNDTMEIAPGANMTINGTVHGNTNIYIDPNSSATLTFDADISATGTLNLTWSPLNPSYNSPAGTTAFDGNHLADVNPLNLPIGTNTSGSTSNTDASVNAILQPPLAGESPTSTIGTNRLYNQVDMIITISNGNQITVTSGVGINNAATVISNNQWASFINTNGTFYNMRDGTDVDPVDINVGNLRNWSATNTVLRPVLAAAPSRSSATADVQSIYVLDERFMSNTVITTNVSYSTNTAATTTSSYPVTNTYFPPVTTNTVETTSATLPNSGTYIPPIQTTNVIGTTSTNSPNAGTYTGTVTNNTTNYTGVPNYPAAGTFTGTVTTNTTTVHNSSTHPSSGNSAGDYTGTITTNGSGANKTYTYTEITGYNYSYTSYSYAMITGYIFNGITGYSYSGITGISTNYTYITNYVQYAEPGIVLTNGGTLPSNGLSVITPDPAYVVGNWNVTNNNNQGMTQTFNVADTLPSAIYADAINIFSPAWTPDAVSNSISARTATPDTVNAAILTGNVPSNGQYYSGGVENFVRFQENWSGVDFYYNGSMVEMFPSQIANKPWPGTGAVYNPPTREWSFDTNFSNPSKLPPLTPRVTYLNRTRWSSLTPGTTVF